MADPISIGENILEVAVFIHRVIGEVTTLPEYAKKLDYKIQLMKPSIDTLTSMKAQQQQLQDACKREPQLNLFGDVLSKMLTCIEEVKAFIDDIKDMSNLRKIREKNTVKKKFEKLEWELDELQKSIQFGVMIEVRKEIESNQKVDKMQTLIKHVRKSGSFSAASGSSVTSQPRKAIGESDAGIIVKSYFWVSMRRINCIFFTVFLLIQKLSLNFVIFTLYFTYSPGVCVFYM